MSDNAIYKETYHKLLSQLERLTAEEQKVRAALAAIKPLFSSDPPDPVYVVESKATKDDIQPKSFSGTNKEKVFAVISTKPSTWWTTPDILKVLYPGLEGKERKNKIIQMSITLSQLIEDGKVIKQNNDGGAGNVYKVK